MTEKNTIRVYEDNASNAALATQITSQQVLALSSVLVDMPSGVLNYDTAPAHTYVSDDMLPMPASYSFATDDPRAIRIPEGAKFCGIYFKHFLSGGDSSIGQNENMWLMLLLMLGLVPDGTMLKPLTVLTFGNDIRCPRTLDNASDYTLSYFEYILDAEGYQHVLSEMTKMTIPAGITHLYPMVRYLNAALYPPLPGPLTFHVRFW